MTPSESSTLPVVAIVGRMNVGKSTLFNRLTEDDNAIVSSWAGTTRDINSAMVWWRGIQFELQDTGGLDVKDDEQLEERVIAAALKAASAADCILFVIDGQTGLLPADEKIARELRKTGRPILLIANKADNQRIGDELPGNVYELGFGDPLRVSSKNGRGTGELLDEVFETLNIHIDPSTVEREVEETVDAYEEGDADGTPTRKKHPIRVAIIGRPNVGKSSLVNAILGEDRVIVADKEHTTRDTNDIRYRYNDQDYVLIDTAGMRKRKNVGNDWDDNRLAVIEKQSVSASIRAIERADVVVLMLESQKRVTAQDKKIADLANRFGGKGLIIALNKWDLIEDKDSNTISEFTDYFDQALPYLRWAPMIFISAQETVRVRKILDLVSQVAENYHRNISQEECNEIFHVIEKLYHPKQGGTRKYKKRNAGMKQLSQIGTTPPHFYLKARHPKDVPSALVDTIERELRDRHDFSGVRIVIETGI